MTVHKNIEIDVFGRVIWLVLVIACQNSIYLFYFIIIIIMITGLLSFSDIQRQTAVPLKNYFFPLIVFEFVVGSHFSHLP